MNFAISMGLKFGKLKRGKGVLNHRLSRKCWNWGKNR